MDRFDGRPMEWLTWALRKADAAGRSREFENEYTVARTMDKVPVIDAVKRALKAIGLEEE